MSPSAWDSAHAPPVRDSELRARIQMPDVPDGAIERRDLLARLDAELGDNSRPLLVCAPAGFGKSTLMAQWGRRSSEAGHAVAWLTCTERANDPTALFVDLRDALGLALTWESPGASVQLMQLAVPTGVSADSELDAMLMLLDDLTSPLALVIDDLHVVASPASLAMLESLALGLPGSVQLVLGTRVEPQPLLTSVRLRRGLIELTEPELALTRAEVAEVIEEAGAEAALLTDPLFTQSEGWPAAVRLGVMAARAGRLGGRLSLPLTYDASVTDYLTREIEAALPADALTLLRTTAVLSEMTPALAATLSGRADAGDILEGLFRGQALVRRTGAAGEPTYVVHALLRSHLLVRLAATDRTAPARQHAAAARWLAAEGRPERALDHALAAHEPALTASLLRTEGPTLLVAGRAGTVIDALAMLPPDLWDADLAGLAALARADSGDLPGARHALVRAERAAAVGGITAQRRAPEVGVSEPGADEASSSELPTLLRIAQFHVRRLEGSPDAPELPDAFGDVLGWPPAATPAPEDLDRQLLLLVSRGQWEFATGRYDQSWLDLRLALDLATTHRRDRIMLQAMSTLSAVHALVGDAAAEDRYVAEVLSLIEARGWATHPAMANVYTAGAWAASLMLLPDRAEQLQGLAVEATRGNVDPEYATYTALIEATLQAERPGDVTGAMTMLARFAQSGPSADVTPRLRAFGAMHRVRMMLMRGDLAGAQAAVEDFQRWFPNTADPLISHAQVLAARGMWEDCLATVRRIHDRSLHVGVPVYEVVLPLLESVANERLGRRSAARGALLRALDVAGPRGVVRPFWEAGPVLREMLERQRGRFGVHDEFVATILARWDALTERAPSRPLVATADGVPLTPRELEVLRELPTLMTAEELAAAQVVSVNTIRTHMRGLYRKLGVSTRRDAVRRGRELGLL